MQCMHYKTEHTDQHYERVVYSKTPLYGPWAGWRMAEKDLVSPDGDRISPHRLRGLLWVERAKARIHGSKRDRTMRRDLVAIIPARERLTGQA